MAEEQIKDTQSDPLPPLESIYLLMVQVLGATGLEAADFTGSSDPYCKIIANKQSWRTKTIQKNTNPTWNEETQFVFFEGVEAIKFEIYDEDSNSKNDMLGFAILETKDFYNEYNNGLDGSIPLQKCKKGAKIQVKVNGRLIKPLELEKRCISLESECKKQEGEIASKKETISDLMKKNAQFAEQKNKLIQNQQELDFQLSQIKNEIKRCKDQNRAKEAKINKLKQKKNEYENKNNKKQKEIGNKRVEIQQEQARLKEAQQQYENLQKEVNEKREQLNQY